MNRIRRRQDGFSLVEVMVAMVILAFTMLGVASMFKWGDLGLTHGAVTTRALTLLQARLEAKRVSRWESLLVDDVDLDGTPDVIMKDDGYGPDRIAGDGIFTGSAEQEGIQLIWTVQGSSPDSIMVGGAAVIQVTARYHTNNILREVSIGTLRANPSYIGVS